MQAFVAGVGLMLIFEGILPALSPPLYRSMVEQLQDLAPETMRKVGFGVMLFGASIVWSHLATGLWQATAVMLVLEGVLPAFSPSLYQRQVQRLASLPELWQRGMGIAAIIVGLLLCTLA